MTDFIEIDKDIIEFVLPSKLKLDVSAVLAGEGADPDKIFTRSPQLAEIAESALKSGIPLLSPVFFRKHLELDGSKQLIQDIFKGQHWIQNQVMQAASIDFVVCTIGPDLENLSSAMMKEDGPLALALDGLANAAVNHLAAFICEKISHDAESKGFQSTLPLGPGIPEWPVEQGQPLIFQLVKPENQFVRLTESCLMIPRKSNSFIVASGKEINVHGTSCDNCNLRETCRYKIRKSGQV